MTALRRVCDIDSELLATRAKYYAAIDAFDDDEADKQYAQLNDLLEQRIHIPLQRQAGESS